MTEISFHLHIDDMQQHTLRLLQKIWKTEQRVALLGPPDFLQSVSDAVWGLTPTAFLAHCWADDALPVQEAGCLVLARPEQLGLLSGQISVLVQWSEAEQPESGFERYARLVELVPRDEAAKAKARARWKYYQHRAYPLQMHDLQAKSQATLQAKAAR